MTPREWPLAGARVLLVSLADDLTCVGLRTLAAVLRAQGAETVQAYLPAREDPGGAAACGQLVELARGATMVGFSVLSIDAGRARTYGRALREAGVPVAWGGPFPTLRPAESGDAADWVCRGDGEVWLPTLVAALLNGREPAETLPPAGAPTPAALLDTAPLVEVEGAWILVGGRLRPATAALWRAALAHNAASRDTGTVAYETVTSRGCPHACGFCGTTALRAAVPGPPVRFRSVDSVIGELRQARAAFPFLTGVGFADDNLPARPLPELERFCARYREEIGLPFLCLGSPATLDRARLALLRHAGLARVKMGIQSGSAAVQRALDRETLHARLPEALAAIAAEGRGMLPARFDLLVDLPFQTLEDELATLRLVADLPRPFRLELNSLRLMDGTPLAARALREGWSTPDAEVSFKRVAPRYPNLLLALSRNGRLPPALLRLLAAPPLVRRLSVGRPARGLAWAWGGLRVARGRAE